MHRRPGGVFPLSFALVGVTLFCERPLRWVRLSGSCLNVPPYVIMGVSTWNGARTHLLIYFWKERVPVMGKVQIGHSLVRESGVVRWRGGSRLFTERFADATGKVTARRSGNGGTKPVGGSADTPAPFVKTWVLTGSLGTPNARVVEVD